MFKCFEPLIALQILLSVYVCLNTLNCLLFINYDLAPWLGVGHIFLISALLRCYNIFIMRTEEPTKLVIGSVKSITDHSKAVVLFWYLLSVFGVSYGDVTPEV